VFIACHVVFPSVDASPSVPLRSLPLNVVKGSELVPSVPSLRPALERSEGFRTQDSS
jgi:hypothetical protein